MTAFWCGAGRLSPMAEAPMAQPRGGKPDKSVARQYRSMDKQAMSLWQQGDVSGALQCWATVADAAASRGHVVYQGRAMKNVAVCLNAMGRTVDATAVLENLARVEEAAAGLRDPAPPAAATNANVSAVHKLGARSIARVFGAYLRRRTLHAFVAWRSAVRPVGGEVDAKRMFVRPASPPRAGSPAAAHAPAPWTLNAQPHPHPHPVRQHGNGRHQRHGGRGKQPSRQSRRNRIVEVDSAEWEDSPPTSALPGRSMRRGDPVGSVDGVSVATESSAARSEVEESLRRYQSQVSRHSPGRGRKHSKQSRHHVRTDRRALEGLVESMVSGLVDSPAATLAQQWLGDEPQPAASNDSSASPPPFSVRDSTVAAATASMASPLDSDGVVGTQSTPAVDDTAAGEGSAADGTPAATSAVADNGAVPLPPPPVDGMEHLASEWSHLTSLLAASKQLASVLHSEPAIKDGSPSGAQTPVEPDAAPQPATHDHTAPVENHVTPTPDHAEPVRDPATLCQPEPSKPGSSKPVSAPVPAGGDQSIAPPRPLPATATAATAAVAAVATDTQQACHHDHPCPMQERVIALEATVAKFGAMFQGVVDVLRVTQDTMHYLASTDDSEQVSAAAKMFGTVRVVKAKACWYCGVWSHLTSLPLLGSLKPARQHGTSRNDTRCCHHVCSESQRHGRTPIHHGCTATAR